MNNIEEHLSNESHTRLAREWRYIRLLQKINILIYLHKYMLCQFLSRKAYAMRRGIFRRHIENFIIHLYPAHWVMGEKTEKKKYKLYI